MADSRHLIRKRSRERQENQLVENSKLYKQAITEIMTNRAQILSMNKTIRELYSALEILRLENDHLREATHDSQEDPTGSQEIIARSEEPALPLGA